MKKIIISESQFRSVVNELFDSNHLYDVSLIKSTDYSTKTQYDYVFTTKDKVKYRVMLLINDEGLARIDFDTVGPGANEIIGLINKYDAIKVFNTLKSIIDNHKDIKKLIIHSTEERNQFYKKLLDYFNIKYDDSNTRMIVAYLNSI